MKFIWQKHRMIHNNAVPYPHHIHKYLLPLEWLVTLLRVTLVWQIILQMITLSAVYKYLYQQSSTATEVIPKAGKRMYTIKINLEHPMAASKCEIL